MAQTSRLLLLPRELRLCILEYLFADVKTINVGFPSRTPWHGSPQKYHPAVGEVCHQLRAEALTMLYNSCRVVLLLRYQEGRRQVQRWIDIVLQRPEISENVQEVSLQYFEHPHRSTSLLLEMQDLCISNRKSWLHPLIGTPLECSSDTERALQSSPLSRLESLEGKPLQLFLEAEKALQRFIFSHSSSGSGYRPSVYNLMRGLVDLMLAPVQNSRLLRCESMANLRLHGHTDFQLRFEIISIMYSSFDR